MKVAKSNLFVCTLLVWAWEKSQREAEAVAFESEKLEERSRELQRNLRSVSRAVRLMLFFAGLAVVGLGLSTVLIPEWPQTMRQFLMMLPIKAACALGLASLGCAFLFSGLGLFYHMELNWLRVKSGELASGLLQPRESALLPLPLDSSVAA